MEQNVKYPKRAKKVILMLFDNFVLGIYLLVFLII
ncbi:uncharacterized protein METZ01_LOCUS139411 [marine metagenome]|uniref:Uncharacterized protein n=1 Tax=marine metagenome TaxID=408172 RepID=A0A381ZCR2_9ZZZZ